MGRVIFIGAGPGAHDLITLRGARALGLAQVVLFDALTDPELKALAPGAQWVDVGKRGFSAQSGEHTNGQARINALLVEHARRVDIVVRLKGGDPSIFGPLGSAPVPLAPLPLVPRPNGASRAKPGRKAAPDAPRSNVASSRQAG